MKRTRTSRKADFILTADLHLTEATPVARMDDYLGAQSRKLGFLRTLSKQHGCPVLCAGDVFDSWKASPWLCSLAFQALPRPFVTIPGQHDLPMHSLAHYDRSTLALLEIVSKTQFHVLMGEGISFGRSDIVGRPFGSLKDFDPTRIDPPDPARRRILLLHELVWPDARPSWSKGGDWTSEELLDQFGGYFDLILTGDNHTPFVRQREGALLVNPGSMLRITADQADHTPRCYLYYAETNEVVSVEYPIERDVHNREHLDRARERDERIAAYIERMSDNWELGLSFRKNLEAFFAANDVSTKVRELVWQHLEAEEV